MLTEEQSQAVVYVVAKRVWGSVGQWVGEKWQEREWRKRRRPGDAAVGRAGLPLHAHSPAALQMAPAPLCLLLSSPWSRHSGNKM